MATQTTTHVDELKINRLTKALYDGIADPSSNELYIVTDEQVDYSELTNKPTIGNATLTIQKNGTTVQTFGANATSNVTANITVPTTAADVNAVAANAAITGATKCKITYDSKGLVTAGADLAASDIPNLSLSKITDVTATAAELNVLDGITASTTELNYVDGVTSNVQTQLNTITGKIPSAATTSNQLADKDFVNSSINAVAAYYVTSNTSGDAFATHAALVAGPYYYDGAVRTPTKNDYAIVLVDEDHNNASTRYTYTGSQWAFQYVVNDTAMTQAQINAINSGITSSKVGNYDTHIADTTIHVTSTDKTNWNNKVDKVSTASKLYGTNSSGAQTTYTLTSGATANTVAYRSTNGVLSVGTPTDNGHAATKKYVDDGLVSKQATLISGTNIKTINSQSILGSGDLTVDGLPSQSGQSGKFLTTDGTDASWATINVLPSQTGNSGKFLTTNGTTASWGEIAEYTANEVETLWNSL